MNESTDKHESDAMTIKERDVEGSRWRLSGFSIALVSVGSAAIVSMMFASNIVVLGLASVASAVLATAALADILAECDSPSQEQTFGSGDSCAPSRKLGRSFEFSNHPQSTESIADEDRRVTEFVKLIESQDRSRNGRLH